MTTDITWLGQSWFRAVSEGKTVHFDPLSAKYAKRLGPGKPLDPSEKADLVLISHSHPDHWDEETVRSLTGPNTSIVAPHKPAKSIDGAKEIHEGESLSLNGIDVSAVPAYNIQRIYHPKGKGVGYLVKLGGSTIYHAGDTDFIPEMSSLGKVDVALLPIGGKFTMDVKAAAQAAKAIAPAVVVPMHNLDTDLSEIAKLLADTPSIRVVVLKPGETFKYG
ncbi:MAG: MBL fold metallo-hydrolase [Methanomassiliicoccales archaeon]|jgi:L-ascorbate metabolism protein UlaG (beta-lactamase superfamily)